ATSYGSAVTSTRPSTPPKAGTTPPNAPCPCGTHFGDERALVNSSAIWQPFRKKHHAIRGQAHSDNSVHWRFDHRLRATGGGGSAGQRLRSLRAGPDRLPLPG